MRAWWLSPPPPYSDVRAAYTRPLPLGRSREAPGSCGARLWVAWRQAAGGGLATAREGGVLGHDESVVGAGHRAPRARAGVVLRSGWRCGDSERVALGWATYLGWPDCEQRVSTPTHTRRGGAGAFRVEGREARALLCSLPQRTRQAARQGRVSESVCPGRAGGSGLRDAMSRHSCVRLRDIALAHCLRCDASRARCVYRDARAS